MILVAGVAAACATLLAGAPRIAPAPCAREAPRTRSRPSTVTVAAASAGLLALALLPPVLAVPGAICAALVAGRVVSGLEPAAVRRRRAQLEHALPEVADLMATCLAAGASSVGALTSVAQVLEAPMRDELQSFVGRLDLGADPVAVWASMAGHPQLGPLGRALRRSAETGASVAAALNDLSLELRAQQRAVTEARARAVEVKASLPLGLCLLPAFVLVGIVPMVAGSFSMTFLGG